MEGTVLALGGVTGFSKNSACVAGAVSCTGSVIMPVPQILTGVARGTGIESWDETWYGTQALGQLLALLPLSQTVCVVPDVSNTEMFPGKLVIT